ncbi:hypothetical protein [Comamonas sp.]|uniref:hypothetical protein n=1 Tax=Comamonas sp. TaxID=34028 RepID=UPI003A92D12C
MLIFMTHFFHHHLTVRLAPLKRIDGIAKARGGVRLKQHTAPAEPVIGHLIDLRFQLVVHLAQRADNAAGKHGGLIVCHQMADGVIQDLLGVLRGKPLKGIHRSTKGRVLSLGQVRELFDACLGVSHG